MKPQDVELHLDSCNGLPHYAATLNNEEAVNLLPLNICSFNLADWCSATHLPAAAGKHPRGDAWCSSSAASSMLSGWVGDGGAHSAGDIVPSSSVWSLGQGRNAP